MAVAGLDTLSNELFECIVRYLDLDSIRNLRLVNRKVSFKTAQDHFKSFFRRKHVDFTESAIQDLIQQTSRQSNPACLVQKMILVGVVYNPKILEDRIRTGMQAVTKRVRGRDVHLGWRKYTDEELETFRENLHFVRKSMKRWPIKLLEDALGNLPELRKVELQIRVCDKDTTTRISPDQAGSKSFPDVFRLAERMFETAVQASRGRKFSVESLDIFSDPAVSHCALPCNMLDNLFQEIVWTFEFRLDKLKSLSLSIADPFDKKPDTFPVGQQNEFIHRLQGEVWNAGYTHGLINLLQACRNLESLNFRWWQFLGQAMFLWGRRRYVADFLRMAPVSSLQKIRLEGLECTDEDLLAFVKSHGASIRTLALVRMVLRTGCSFAPLFDYLDSEECGVEDVSVKMCYGQGTVVRYEGLKRRS